MTCLDSLRLMIEETLEKLTPSKDTLWEAGRYSLFSGGKRLRPLLTVATVADLKGDIASALQPACALELIHTYSLIHDDLPCMDDDDIRRGQPTLHRVYTEGHAVLTGDFLLTYAFELLATAPRLTAEQRIDLVATLAKYSGAHGMIGGQVADIASKGKVLDAETLRVIHLGKTAALITAALEFAAIICNVPPSDRHHLAMAGEHLGIAFQIRDDLLDEGKPDEPSAVTLFGKEGAEQLAQDHFNKGVAALGELPAPLPLLAPLATALLHRSV